MKSVFHFVHLGTDNQKKISHLIALQALGDLTIFRGDLTDEGSFDAAIAGSDIVFHVATPVHFGSQDPEVHNIRRNCLAKTCIWSYSFAAA